MYLYLYCGHSGPSVDSNHTCIPSFVEICELICLNHSIFSMHPPPTVGNRPGSEVVNKMLADVSKEAPKGDGELQSWPCP